MQLLCKARGWGIIMQFELLKSETMARRKGIDPTLSGEIFTPMCPYNPKSSSMER